MVPETIRIALGLPEPINKMTLTILEHITIANPVTVQKSGSSSGTQRTRRNYGPHHVVKWKGVTISNLRRTFEHILSQRLQNPKFKDANEVPSREAEIYTEISVDNLATLWIRPIVQRALDTIYSIHSTTLPDSALARGNMQFRHNDGPGNIKDDKGKYQRPYWLVYQNGRRAGHIPGLQAPYVFNLIPGDSKVSTKWSSEWMNHPIKSLKNQADGVLRQVTKYMHLWQTRYSFILSDKELVPVRLSVFSKNSEEQIESGVEDSQTSRLSETNDFLFGSETPSQDRNVDDPLPKKARPVSYVLEWCRIGWDAHGTSNVTINLTLYWLALLAAEDVSIKE
ncbi:hypothetical protein GGR57DRAFT_504930 [Xylariaceae sp. FL1272]|nr:hypothetical protein GGR57DRAFT_504930 [Xylariaceae sp. FL1272]